MFDSLKDRATRAITAWNAAPAQGGQLTTAKAIKRAINPAMVEPLLKAKKVSFSYSAILLIVAVARTGESIKIFGVDATVGTFTALIILLIPATYYASGVFLEYLKLRYQLLLSAGEGEMGAFDKTISEAKDKLTTLVNDEAVKTAEFQSACNMLIGNVDNLAQQWHYGVGDAIRPFNFGNYGGPFNAQRERDVWAAITDFTARVNDAAVKGSVEDVKQHLNKASDANALLVGAIDRLSTNVHKIHDDAHSLFRRTITWFDLMPPLVLFAAALLFSVPKILHHVPHDFGAYLTAMQTDPPSGSNETD